MRMASLATWEKFKPCKEYNVFAGNKNTFGSWCIGEPFLLLIGDQGVVLARIDGDVFYSEDMIWDDDIYEWRVRISIVKEFSGDKGRLINNMIRKLLRESVGPKYGYILRNRTKVDDVLEKSIMKIIDKNL